MSFDLLANPFATLGLAGNAPVGAIASRTRELGTAEASAASKALISPRTRLAAELSFLPGATEAEVAECIRTLREDGKPDLWPLAPIARANVLAHLASSRRATSSQLRDLVSMQQTAPPTAIEAVNRGRNDTSMPPASPELAEGALQALAGQHAEAVVDGLLSLESGAAFLSELLSEAGSTMSPRGAFLRQCTAGWERAKASDLSRILESAEPLEAALREDPKAETARKLAQLIPELAAATRPQREAARLLGLQHELSLDARSRWQSVALDLNNRLDAIPEAVTVLEALADAFDDQDELQTRIARNLQVCRERVASGEGTPEFRRLTKAIAAATAQPRDFDQCGLVEGNKTPKCSAIVAELHDSFVAATDNATTDLPWSLLRGLILELHNQHNSIAATWSLTVLAIGQAYRSKAGRSVLPLFQGDKRNLRAQMLQRDLDVAARAKRKGAMRTIAAELITLVDAPSEKAEYSELLGNLKKQAVVSYLKWGFWAAVAGVLAISYLKQAPIPVRTAAAPATFRPTPDVSPLQRPAPAIAPPVDRTATRPFPGNATLTISGLRWCRYGQARADAAKAYLDALRLDPGLKISRFNAAVDIYNEFLGSLNASCGSYTYRKSDASIIDAELNEQRAALAALGKGAVESAYLASGAQAPASLPAYTAPPSYVPPDPVAPVPAPYTYRPAYVPPPAPATPQPDLTAPATASAAYVGGQNDRRAWEAWMGSVSGATHDGAEWWAGIRSTRSPPSCTAAPPGNDQASATLGCSQAKTRLGNSDRRRRMEPDYRAGWNNP